MGCCWEREFLHITNMLSYNILLVSLLSIMMIERIMLPTPAIQQPNSS